MAFLLPRVAFTTPARCGPAFTRASGNDFAPLFSLFDDTLAEVARASRPSHQHGPRRRSFNPRFDVIEAKDSYSLEGELPGIDQKDLSIEFTDEHTLTIKGRHEQHHEAGTRPTTSASSEGVDAASTPDQTAESSGASVTASHHATVEDEAPTTTSTEAPANASAVEEAASSEVAKPTTPAVTPPQYWVSERRVGQFERSFSFPLRVDQDAVKASLRNGILSIVVPKAAAPESRRISIE